MSYLAALLREMSRTPGGRAGHLEKRDDEYGRLSASGIHMSGRIVLNLWRIVSNDVKLANYSFESCVAAVMRLRVPRFDQGTLFRWLSFPHSRGRALQHLVRRARLDLAMLEKLDVLGRTGEMARTFG